MKRDSKRSGVRWVILGLLFLISLVTYIDRVNISVAGVEIMPAIGLTKVQLGTVFSSFVFGYALFQIPGGWLGDRWGSRRTLTLALLWWSLFTILTALAAQSFLALVIGPVGALLIVRFLIGVGEAAALPNFNRTVANWFAPSERGLGIGVSIGGIGFGSAMTPPLVVWLMIHYGWKSAFYFTGILGVLAAGLWYSISRDSPADHPRVNRAELDWIRGGENKIEPVLLSPKGSFKEVLLSPPVWFLTASYTMLGYVAYIYLSWFFIYLVNVRHFEVLKGSFLSTAPFLAMALFCPLGGWASDRMARKYGPIRGQRRVGALGMFLTSGLIYAGALAVDPYTAVLFLSLGAGILYSTVGAYWSSTIEISREHSGALSGLMNTGANLGGTLSPMLTPYLGEKYGWPLALSVAAGAAFLGGLLWLAVRLPGSLSPKEPFS